MPPPSHIDKSTPRCFLSAFLISFSPLSSNLLSWRLRISSDVTALTASAIAFGPSGVLSHLAPSQ
eukprot:CAMPEP_0174709192 /NCGR_PEP_ID=MMETSP1094-20130205/11235_1 /TAXON_ID=156173 /ORGANISM="Chrysochromulina brevifilum, Strain UTEX LB 985" /LENGTH=64 /DNA_ID=CAMNT_0015907847 /DNA_START=143 /DNA_END=337 /DNA_ORIENTATION=-